MILQGLLCPQVSGQAQYVAHKEGIETKEAYWGEVQFLGSKYGALVYNGKVFDNPGLYVRDSSWMPGPIGSLSSMAVAAWSSATGG